MIEKSLQTAVAEVYDWCEGNHVPCDLSCDEHDLQCVKLFTKSREMVGDLMQHLQPLLQTHGIHCKQEKIRGGTIILLSLDAITESCIQKIVDDIGEEIEQMSFREKIAAALDKTPTPRAVTPAVRPQPQLQDLVESAKRLIDKPAPRKIPKDRHVFTRHLHEALDGIANPTNTQAPDLFGKFAKALQVLGNQMGVGPLQDALRKQGINWKKSDDGQSIILYIINAQTKAPQPLARISAETLQNPNDFEEQLTTMLDFAKGDAPGSFKQKQKEMQDQQKALRDIAQSVVPDENDVQQQMNGQQAADAAAVAALPKQ